MGLSHCPLCIALAVLSVLRAGAHLTLLGMSLLPGPQGLQTLQLGFALRPLRGQPPHQRHRPIGC
jgi:hypothetical protein